MAAFSMITAGLGLFTDIASGFLEADALFLQGLAAKEAGERNAENVRDHAKFIKSATQDEIAEIQIRADRLDERLEGTARAVQGASGLRLTGSVLDVIRSNAMNIQRDADIATSFLKKTRQNQIRNLEFEAKELEGEGLRAYDSAIRAGEFAKLSGFFSGLQGVGSTFAKGV